MKFCYGYGHNRDTGEVCMCDVGLRLARHIERQAASSDGLDGVSFEGNIKRAS